MAQCGCIRDCFVGGHLYKRGESYNIDPKAAHAKFFEFDPKDVPPVPAVAEEDPDAKLKAEAAALKAQNAALRANKAQG